MYSIEGYCSLALLLSFMTQSTEDAATRGRTGTVQWESVLYCTYCLDLPGKWLSVMSVSVK
jgi:hypothetical protein